MLDMALKNGGGHDFRAARQVRPPKYTAGSLRNSRNQLSFQHHVAVAWQNSSHRRRQPGDCCRGPTPSDVDSDVALLTQALRDAADASFDTPRNEPRKPWISARTFELISMTNQMRSLRRNSLQSQRTHVLGLGFRLWLAVLPQTATIGVSHIVICSTHAACCLYERTCRRSDRRIAMLEYNLKMACKVKAKYVALDKVASIEAAADEAQMAANANDSKMLFSIVRRLSGTPARALSTLKDESGNVISSNDELVARWRSHFCKVFKASIAEKLPTAVQLHSREEVPGGHSIVLAADPKQNNEYLYLDWSTYDLACAMKRQGFSPTLNDVEGAISALKGDSGVGVDRISAWIIKAGGRPVAAIILEIIEDILTTEYIPVVWRGGRLVVLFKGKGSATDPDNYRGILVSDHLGKILTSLIQRHLGDVYMRMVGQAQFGAVAGRGTALASFSLRSFADVATMKGWSLFILCVDLSKAFDYAIREVVMGWMPTFKDADMDAKSAHLEKLGVLKEHSAELAKWIDETGGLLRLCATDPVVVALIASLHDGSWFQLPNDPQYIISVAGGRQGCKLGALVFNAIYSIALARIRAELAEFDNITLAVRSTTQSPFWVAGGAECTFAKSDLADESFEKVVEITYVDDEALHVAATSPKILMTAIPTVMRHLCQTFGYFGFRINWKPGKTECFLSLRGKHAQVQKDKLLKENGATSIHLPVECGHPSLRVVRKYVHLGSGIDENCSAWPDVQIRTSSAMAAYAPISKKVFGNPRLSRGLRMRLWMSLVISRLLYNVHVWSVLSQSMYTRLNSVYMRALRRIAGRSCYDATSAHRGGTDAAVRLELGASSLQCLLMQRRLTFLASILKNGSHGLHALLATTGRDSQPLPWVRLIRSDLQRISKLCAAKLSDLGHPLIDPDKWASFIVKFPGEWKQLVKSCSITTMEMDRPLKKDKLAAEAPLASRYRCNVFEATFPTQKGLDAHARAKHLARSDMSRFIGKSLTCPVCYGTFSSRPRLLAHVSEKRNRGLRRFSCHQVYCSGLVQPVCHLEFTEALESDKHIRTAAKRSGHTTPLSETLAKRPKTGTSIVDQQTAYLKRAAEGSEVAALPLNAVALNMLPPKKRVRSKTSQDDVVLQHIQLRAAA